MQRNPKLLIPGLRNSGPDHWQSHWERAYPTAFHRVIQDNWAAPDREAWTLRLQAYLTQHPSEDYIFIGHSVGCATLLHWHQRYGLPVKGFMLVAPSDVDRPDYPSYITGFAPLPLHKLPFPSLVVASDDDHVVDPERARYFADCWGSHFHLLRQAGHIEGKNGYGPWPEGLALLQHFLEP
ncbi:MAG: alpha/beta hydrolase [Bacteroidota bacterium]